MAAPTIPNGEEHFFPIIYEGNGAGQRVGKFVPFTDNGTIANSVIFNSADSPVLSRTPSGTGTSKKTFTISAWIKNGRLINSAGDHSRTIYGVNHGGGSRYGIFGLYSGGSGNVNKFRLFLGKYTSGSSTTNFDWYTNRTLEDTSKWYHLMAAVDTTNSTADDRIKMYIDGERITSFASSSNPSLNDEFYFGSEYANYISTYDGSYGEYDGYIAELNFVDGTALTPDTFGVTDTSTGRWIPKALTGITYGTNGFRLQFGSSSALGDDTSGNNNDFSVSNLVAGDQTTDSPTQNHATLQGTGGTLSEGNTTLDTGSSEFAHHNATLKPKSGKYYAEFTCDAMGRSEVGVASTTKLPYSANNVRLPATDDGSLAGYMWYGYNGKIYTDSGSGTAGTYATYTTNDIISIALDLDNLTVQFFKNNSSVGTFNLPNSNYTFCMGDGATGYGGGWTANFGQKSFTYTPPTGFVALQQDNLPETARGVSGFVWIKSRDTASAHMLFDSSRGPQLRLKSDSTSEQTLSQGTVTKFLKGGYAVGDQTAVNKSGDSVVSWNWVANSGTTGSNGDGSISSTVQANTTAGFSIVKYTGTGSAGTVGHGLSSAPEWIFGRPIEQTGGYNWSVYHKSLTSASYYISLNVSTAESSNSNVWGTAPSSSVISVGTSMSASTEPMILYCWHGVDGFSKFGKYTGNGSADGPFVYTGFRPAWIMIKNAGATASWFMLDGTRNTFNPAENWLVADDPQAEVVTSGDRKIDFLSNGFKIRATTTDFNGSSANMIYMAFAEHPFVGDGTSPVTAR